MLLFSFSELDSVCVDGTVNAATKSEMNVGPPRLRLSKFPRTEDQFSIPLSAIRSVLPGYLLQSLVGGGRMYLYFF